MRTAIDHQSEKSLGLFQKLTLMLTTNIYLLIIFSFCCWVRLIRTATLFPPSIFVPDAPSD